jgi:hypothetical protein
VEIGEITADFNRDGILLPIGQRRITANIYNEMSVQFVHAHNEDSVAFGIRFRMYDQMMALKFENISLEEELNEVITQFTFEEPARLLSSETNNKAAVFKTHHGFFCLLGNSGKLGYQLPSSGLKNVVKSVRPSILNAEKSAIQNTWWTLNVSRDLGELAISDVMFLADPVLRHKQLDELNWTVDSLKMIPLESTFIKSLQNYAPKKDELDSLQSVVIPWVHLSARSILWTPSFRINVDPSTRNLLADNEILLANLLALNPAVWEDSKIITFDEANSIVAIARKVPDSEEWIVASVNSGPKKQNLVFNTSFLTSDIQYEQMYFSDEYDSGRWETKMQRKELIKGDELQIELVKNAGAIIHLYPIQE